MATNTITLETAQDWARTFRRNPANHIIGHVIPRENLEQLLACSEGRDVRVYFGIDETGEQKLMFVSMDASGNDLIDSKRDQYIYDKSQTVPPMQDISSPLNSF